MRRLQGVMSCISLRALHAAVAIEPRRSYLYLHEFRACEGMEFKRHHPEGLSTLMLEVFGASGLQLRGPRLKFNPFAPHTPQTVDGFAVEG